MEKKFLVICVAILYVLGGIALSGCGGSEHDHGGHDHEHVEADHDHSDSHDEAGDHATEYKCPMQCEGEKTYDKPGKCPECKMSLEKVAHDENDHDGHDHDDHSGHNH